MKQSKAVIVFDSSVLFVTAHSLFALFALRKKAEQKLVGQPHRFRRFHLTMTWPKL